MTLPVIAYILAIHLVLGVVIGAIVLAGWRADVGRVSVPFYARLIAGDMVFRAVMVALLWELAVVYVVLAVAIEAISDRIVRVLE